MKIIEGGVTAPKGFEAAGVEAGIKYDVITKCSQTSFGRSLHANMTAGVYNGAGGGAGDLLFTYTIYVAKKDFKKADSIVR